MRRLRVFHFRIAQNHNVSCTVSLFADTMRQAWAKIRQLYPHHCIHEIKKQERGKASVLIREP